MLHEETLALKPGRDLDLAVALRVMDFFWVTHWLRFSAEMAVKWIGTQKELDEAGGVIKEVKPDEFQELKLRDAFDEIVPRFSTDGECWQQIVEKLTESGFSFAWANPDTTETHNAIFQKVNQTAASYTAATQAEAVCKAALKALASSKTA